MSLIDRFAGWSLDHPFLFLGGWWAGLFALAGTGGVLVSWVFAAAFVAGASPGSIYLTVSSIRLWHARQLRREYHRGRDDERRDQVLSRFRNVVWRKDDAA